MTEKELKGNLKVLATTTVIGFIAYFSWTSVGFEKTVIILLVFILSAQFMELTKK